MSYHDHEEGLTAMYVSLNVILRRDRKINVLLIEIYVFTSELLQLTNASDSTVPLASLERSMRSSMIPFLPNHLLSSHHNLYLPSFLLHQRKIRAAACLRR
jgi:hypothetical protein